MLERLYTPAEMIKSKRESLGLTQKEFAELIGLKDYGDKAAHGAKPIPESQLVKALKVIENSLERFLIHPAQFPKPIEEDTYQKEF